MKIINAVEKSEGAGVKVRRSIGVSQMTEFNPFLMLDHFNGVGTAGFPHHPHRGQETITLVLNGAVAHEDFTGSKGILYPGDLQFMTAGKGIVHSEMPIPLDGDPIINGMQLWVDLPESLRNSKPRYRDLRAHEIPETTQDNGKVKIKVILGKSYGIELLQDLAYTPVEYYYVTVAPGGKFTQELDPEKNFFLYTLKGKKLVVNGNELPQNHTLFFKRDGDALEATVPGDSEPVEFVLVGGQVLDQNTIHYGPFVAGSESSINKAFFDYQYARHGFEKLKTWDSFISNGVTPEMEEKLGGGPKVRAELAAKYKVKREAEDKRDGVASAV